MTKTLLNKCIKALKTTKTKQCFKAYGKKSRCCGLGVIAKEVLGFKRRKSGNKYFWIFEGKKVNDTLVDKLLHEKLGVLEVENMITWNDDDKLTFPQLAAKFKQTYYWQNPIKP